MEGVEPEVTLSKRQRSGHTDFKWFWLSFSDADHDRRYLVQEHRGCCAVYAREALEAMAVAWEMGINPGGEVMFQVLDPRVFDRVFYPERVNCLLDTKASRLIVEEIETLSRELKIPKTNDYKQFKKPPRTKGYKRKFA